MGTAGKAKEIGQDPAPARITGGQLALIFFSRTVLNTAHRIIYPFLPSLARGLGISLAAASMLITLRLVAGLAAPFLGPLADRYGRRRLMEIALLIFALAGGFLVGWGTFAAAAIAFTFYGLAKVLYDPAVYAYVGDMVPYARRARAVGTIELSWSSAWLLSVPAAGFLIEHIGWRAPWAVLTVLAVVGLSLTHIGLPPSYRKATEADTRPGVRSLVRSWLALLRQRRIAVLLLTSLLITMAQEIPFIVYGAWLETSFGLGLSTLGVASIVVGLAEASAELGTAVLTDRLGKRRSVLMGLLGLAIGLAALPALARLGLVPALAGLVLVMLAFEFGIVSLLPLATELAPRARATLLSLNVTAFSLGRIAGAVAGGWLWQWQGAGILMHAIVGATCALLAALLMGRGMKELDDQGLGVAH